MNLKKLLDSKTLKIYLCGPTLYDDVHIGNIAPVIIFDFIIRYLKEKKIDYIYIHNLTDIDDKIIKKSLQLKKYELQITKEYEKKYLEILTKMNLIMPTIIPRVSDHILEIQNVIKKLIDKKFAETNPRGVVFNIKKCENYGSISGQSIDQLTNDSDFFLWKKTIVGKKWDSPWGEGRPGWHTECFAFIDKYAGGEVDLHGGGVDLKFPHHENENAHCQAIYNKPLSKQWIHIGHITTKEGKISKSTPNSNKYLMKDLFNYYDANTIKLLFLTNKYSIPAEINEEKFQQIKKEWEEFEYTINRAKSYLIIENIKEKKSKIKEEFLSIIENDLNMPQVFSWLQREKKLLNIALKNNDLQQIQCFYSSLKTHLEWLGFLFKEIHTPEIKNLLIEWKKMMKLEKYNESDQIRKILIEKKII